MGLNDGYDYEELVPQRLDGTPLLDYLTGRYPHSTGAEWRERILSGGVLLDEQPATPETPVRGGQALVWRRPPWREPEAPSTYDLLYRDDDLLAVAKPAGLPTLPGAGFLHNTLLAVVRREFPEAVAMHRLGRWTSGLVLFALTQAARVGVAEQWRLTEVTKRYRALAHGRAASRQFEVTVPIGTVHHPLLGTVHAATTDGRPSRTEVLVLEQRANDFLADVTIATGRPHQIRIHLAAAGHPLTGDPLYSVGGLPLEDRTALPGDPGYHLHAILLGLRHPRSHQPLEIECPPPALLQRSEPEGLG